MSRHESNHYDVAIIGSGIAGATLATILARNGMSVLVFEAGSHPKFAIGESMILETSETMRALAEFYDVPELAYFSSANYLPQIGTSHGVKRHFGFLHHSPGQRQQVGESLQAVIPKHPHGHELHLYRQDVDYFLTTCAVTYGATVLQDAPVSSVEIQTGGVEISTVKGNTFHANYVVDASGIRSVVAQKFDLRTTNLQTHSRALFTHMVGVPDFHQVARPRRDYGIPFSMSEGTLHHIFEGGWLWVIPFNNHARSTNPLCSVGLMLDPRKHPLDERVSPEQEFYGFIQRYPDIAAHFATAKAVRAWTRTGRIQYSSKQIVGERFALLGHAAGFIDPLFSKGLYSTLTSVSVLADLLLTAKVDGDYSASRFEPLEKITQTFIQENDRLIANAYRAFGHCDLWRLMSVQWLLGAYTEYVKLLGIRTQSSSRREYIDQLHGLRLIGGGFEGFSQLAERVYSHIEAADPGSNISVMAADRAIRTLYAEIDWMPLPFQTILDGKNHLPRNKIRPDLFEKKSSFLRSGLYREHFFGEHSMPFLAKTFIKEVMKYSAPAITLRRRLEHA